MYSIDTIGALVRAERGCTGCTRARELGAVDVPNLNPFDDDFWAWKLGAAVRQRAADALEEAKKLPNMIPPLPKVPDPVAPSVDAFGPSGWGGYVVPSLVIAAAATVGVILYRRRNASSRRR